MRFSASWDYITLLMTLFALFCLAGAIIIVYISNRSKILKFFITILLISILCYAFSQAPRSYVITESEIIINTVSKKIKIPISYIKEVKRLEKKEIKGVIRLRGVGGLFGFKGRFFAPKIGEFEGYFTNQKNLVLIKGEKLYVISPDRPNQFLEKINSKIG